MNPPGRGQPLNPTVQIPVFIVTVAFMIFMYRRLRRERAEREASGQPAATPQPTPAWVWVFMITTVAVIAYFQSGKPRPGRPASPGSPWLLWLSLVLPALGVLGIVGLLLILPRFGAAGRVVRLVNRGKQDEAVAFVRARMDRRRASNGAAAPDDPAGNPYSAPSTVPSEAEKRAWAEDWNCLGVIEASRQNWPEAIACYERAEQAGGPATNHFYRANKGFALMEDGRIDEGMPLIEQVIVDLPVIEHWNRAQYRAGLARKLLDLGRLAEARSQLDAAEAGARLARFVPRAARRQLAATIAEQRARIAGGVDDLDARGDRV